MKSFSALIGNCDDLGLVCNAPSNDRLIGIVLKQVFAAAAAIAIISIVLAGIRYTLSTGDPGKIKQAKDTILYSVIGLAVAILAFTIVNLTLGAVEDVTK